MQTALGKALNLFDGKNKLTRGIWAFSLPIFFILLADSAMSYAFPVVVEQTVNSNTMLGIIMALSSVIGFISDFIFPQLLKDKTWRFQLVSAIVLALLFPISVNIGGTFGLVYMLIFGSIIWGIYWELLSFSQQDFIIDEDKSGEYSKDWGVLFLVYQVTTVIGPILGSLLLAVSLLSLNITLNVIQVISLIFAILLIFAAPKKIKHKKPVTIKQTLHILREAKHWQILTRAVWPAMILGITLTAINAVFWTIGGLFGESLFGNGLDWMVIVFFSAPSIIGSIILTRVIVKKRKKRFSQIFLIIGSIFLAMLYFARGSNVFILLLIMLASFSYSFVGPLNESVYSDLLDRMKKGRMHLLGLDKATASIAYIIGPLFAGFLADKYDYLSTFAIAGAIGVVVGVILLIVTPKKIKLPQTQIENMEDLIHTDLK